MNVTCEKQIKQYESALHKIFEQSQTYIKLRDGVILQNAELVKEKRMIEQKNIKLQQRSDKLKQDYDELQQHYDELLKINRMRRERFTKPEEEEEYPFGKYAGACKKIHRSRCKSKKVR